MTIETSLPARFQQELETNEQLAKTWDGKTGPSGSDEFKAYRRDLELVSALAKAGLIFSGRELECIICNFQYGLASRFKGVVLYREDNWCELTADYLERLVSHVGCRSLRYSTAFDLDQTIGKTQWVAEKWIAQGLLTLLVSAPGLGKTRICADVSKRIITPSLGWFSSLPLKLESGSSVVWCDTEAFQGGLRDIIEDFGIPKERIIFPFDDTLREVRLDNDADLQRLERVIEAVTPGLLVVDSLRGSHSREENASGEMQKTLSKLAKMVQRFNMCSLVTHHSNKPFPGEPSVIDSIDRIRGSSAIAANFRAVWALDQPDPDSDQLRLHIIKNNLAPKANPLGLRIAKTGIEWSGEAPQRSKKKTQEDEAREFLIEKLKDGSPKRVKELQEEAEQEGISISTLRRAAKPLNMVKTKKADHWEWSLEEKPASLLNLVNRSGSEQSPGWWVYLMVTLVILNTLRHETSWSR